MNYINTLQNENAQLKEQLTMAEELISEFRTYLITPKFHNDTTIQVRDVDTRLIEIITALHA